MLRMKAEETKALVLRNAMQYRGFGRLWGHVDDGATQCGTKWCSEVKICSIRMQGLGAEDDKAAQTVRVEARNVSRRLILRSFGNRKLKRKC